MEGTAIVERRRKWSFFRCCPALLVLLAALVPLLGCQRGGLLSGTLVGEDSRIAAGTSLNRPVRPRWFSEEQKSALFSVLKASRSQLLGNRDPNGPTCQPYRQRGWTDAGYSPPPAGNPRGGTGFRFLQIYYWDHAVAVKTPVEEFAWHQGPFRQELVAVRERSSRTSEALTPLVEQAARISQSLTEWTSWQDSLQPESSAGSEEQADSWPAYCLARFCRAVEEQDLAEARRWAAETHSALFALADLHRWLEFLVSNQLASLDFQKLGQDLFEEMADKYSDGYVPWLNVSRFPAGSVAISAMNNYFEVERQAEALFRRPREFIDADEQYRRHNASSHSALWSSAVWMTPDVREAFVKLRSSLSPTNQAVWDAAAGTPFERSFMVNQLFRVQKAGAIDQLGQVLSRFDRRFPKAKVHELMDMLPYRASLGMSGYEWGDRFDARLMQVAEAMLSDSRRAALGAAHRWAYTNVYQGHKNYQNMVLSMRAALDMHKYDCIRGTDLIAAAYRNAGWPGVFNVRWCRGDSAHTIGAVAIPDAKDNTAEVLTVDSLLEPGHAEGSWPDSYPRAVKSPYVVELNGRGLDNYVFVGGYFVRGPSAGRVMMAAVPYLPGHAVSKSLRVDRQRPAELPANDAEGEH